MNDDEFEQLLTELLAGAPERAPQEEDHRSDTPPDLEGYEVDASGRLIG